MKRVGRIGFALMAVGIAVGCSLDFPIADPAPGADDLPPGDRPDAGPGPGDDAGGPDGGGHDGGGDPDGGGAPVDHVSGTRLRANVLAGDGAKLFESWLDRELNVDCAFTHAEDGKLRCLPADSDARFYSDADCKAPVLVRAPSSAMPKYILSTGQGCGKQVYAIDPGASIPPAKLFVRGEDGLCSSLSTPAGTLYSAGPKLAPAAFVEATSTTLARSGGLGVVRLVAADGAEQTTEVVDLARGAACAPGEAPELAERCAPSRVAVVSLDYASSACKPLASAEPWSAACAPPSAAVGGVIDSGGGVIMSAPTSDAMAKACDAPLYREIGAAYTGDLFQYGTPFCIDATEPFPAWTWFQVGDKIEPSTFPKIGRRSEGSGAHLQAAVLTTEASERLVARSFFDVARGVMCTARRGDSGDLRCAPEGPVLGNADLRYADDACSVPLYVHPATGCSVPTIVSLESGKTPPVVGMVGAPANPDALFAKSGDRCVQSTDKGTLYTLALLEWSDLIPLTRTTE